MVTLFATLAIFFISSNEDERTRLSLQNQLAFRDKSHKESIDSANARFIFQLDSSGKETIKLLAIYGLRYDSAQRAIEKLVKDSSGKRITIIEDPELSLCPADGINEVFYRNDTLYFKMNLCSAKASSIIDSLKLSILIGDGDYNALTPISLKISDKNVLIEDAGTLIESNAKTLIQIHKANAPKGNMLYIRLSGTYKNRMGSKTIPVDLIFGYDIKNKLFGSATPIPKRYILDRLK